MCTWKVDAMLRPRSMLCTFKLISYLWISGVIATSISPIPDVPPGSHNSVSRESSKDTLADSNRTGEDSHNSIRPKPPSLKDALKGAKAVFARDESSSAGQSSQSPSLSNGARSPSAPVTTLGRPPSQTLQQQSSEPSGSHSPGGTLRGTSSKGDSKFFTNISFINMP